MKGRIERQEEKQIIESKNRGRNGNGGEESYNCGRMIRNRKIRQLAGKEEERECADGGS
jgi:hypothetical protein